MTTTKNLAVSEEFNERVSKKVKDIFMDLLPEEVFTEMVTNEINAFFEESAEFEIVKGHNGGYGSPKVPDKIAGKVSPFRLIVWESVNEIVRKKIGEHLHSEQFRVDVTFNQFGQKEVGELNEFLESKLEQFTMSMARNMFKDLFAAAVSEAQASASSEVHNALANRGY